MWQYFLPAFVKRQKLEFDIVHNLNFHNDWTPSRLWVLKKPFVWGPIGHHSKIPKDYILHVYGYRQYFTEQLKWMTKKYFWQVDPLLRQTVNHADTVLAMNSSVAKVLQIPEAKVVRMPSVSTEAPGERLPHISNGKFTILSAGRFVPLKGFDITIKSFARFRSQLPTVQQDKVELVLVGDGPYKEQLVKLTEELYIEKQVRFIKWLDREDYKQLYANSHVFLFPSHEGAGMVVAEALSYGLPVVCFNNDGPGEFVNDSCGITVPYSRYDTSISKFADALNAIYTDPTYFNKLSDGALEAFKNRFDWNLKGEHLRNVYNEVASRAV
jgi:glycosyltransferase involved in cell wall biosynthesis